MAGYSTWLDTATVTEEERAREGYATPEQCKQSVLLEIDAEINPLKRDQERRVSIEVERTKLEIIRQRVPSSRERNRLPRYLMPV